ncbi:SH3 domain-containing protein [Ochrobactrum sp. BD67]
MFEKPVSKRLLEDHVAPYSDPIAFIQGQAVSLTGKAEIWDGYRWLWAVGPDGRAGWIPDDCITFVDGRAIALRDYSAMELTCNKGATLLVIEETHGWAWCRAPNGVCGWVPLNKLA